MLKALVPVAAGAAKRQITRAATGPDPSLSDNQSAAYVRLLSVRNMLLKKGCDPSRVALRIDTATTTPAPRVFVTVDLETSVFRPGPSAVEAVPASGVAGMALLSQHLQHHAGPPRRLRRWAA